MVSLCVENLSVARGDRLLFSGLQFAVQAGEALHVQGRNGAGKTSLLETLCGLRQPEQGSIRPRPEPEDFHWLGHRNALNLALSARQNLEFWCRAQGGEALNLESALEQLGLQRAAHRPCAQLSTGQKRRAALARLLLMPRPWWFLDEPLAGLDDQGIEAFMQLLTRHLQGGGAAVLSSHQPLSVPTRTLRLA